MSTAVSLLSPADYEAIEAAVMETARGRWFLAEYGRRHRNADTQMLLEAMSRLEDVVRNESVAAGDRVRSGLLDMSAAIARTKADIAALKPEGETGRIEEATEELDSVVSATETATGDILAAAEHIQEIAWTLRERPLDTSHCDALDSLATDIYTACSFQDLTGQRTRAR
jgi:chemotaxis protein CheZ